MPRKSYTVKMYDNKPFTFGWDEDREGPLTQGVVKDLYESQGPEFDPDFDPDADTRDPYFKDKIEPYKPQPTLEQNMEEPTITDTLEGVSFEAPEQPEKEQSTWEWANESWLPNRKSADTALPGLKTLSRAGDWVYSRMAQPIASPLGVATAPIGFHPLGRAALAYAGTVGGAYGLSQSLPKAWEDPTLENVADVGLSGVGLASLPIGARYGAFNKKPGVEVGDDIPAPLDVAAPGPQKRLGTNLFRQRSLLAENPTDPWTMPDVEAPVHELRSPGQPLTAYELAQIPGDEQLTTRDFPTVGGMGRMPGPLKTRTVKSKTEGVPDRTVTVDTTLPRVGGKGEYGVRGTPFFPTVPERMQTSTTQELFRPVTEMLNRMSGRRGPRTESMPVDVETPPVVERFPGIPDEIRAIHERTGANLDEWGRRLPETPLPDVQEPSLGQRIRAERRAARGEPTGIPDVAPINPNRPGGPSGPQMPIQDITPRKPLDGLGRAAESAIPEVKKAAQQIAVDRSNVKKKGAVRQVYDQLGTSGWKILEDLGEPGKEVSRWMQRVRAEGAVQAGRLSSKRRNIIDQVNDKEFEMVVDVVEGKAQSADPKINAAADAVRASLEEAGIYAEEAGAMMADKGGNLTPFQRMKENYFPHKFEPGTFNEESLINQLMKEKKLTYQEAKFVIDNGVKRGPRLLSPQHERTLGLTGYKKTKQAFYEHIDDLINRAEETKNFGPRDEKLHELAAQSVDPEKASGIINEQLGRTTKDPNRQAVANAVNTFEATVKLPLFAMSNMNQAAAIGMRSSTANFLKGMGKSLKSLKSAEDTGALQTVARNTFQDTGQNPVTKGMSKVFQWGKSEEFLRSWAGNTGKAQAETLFNKLKKSPGDKTSRAKLDNLLLEDVDTVLKQDALTPDQIDKAGFRMSELTQGLVDPADLPPIWSADPLMKIPVMFKKFAFQQNRILKGAFKEAATPADKAKLGIKALGLYTAIGEMTEDSKNVLRSAAAGEDPIKDFLDRGGRPEEIWTDNKLMDRMIDNISNAYAMGLIGEVVGQAGSGVTGRLANMTIGPALGDLFGIAEGAARSVKQGSGTPLAKEVVRRAVPLGYSWAKRFPETKRKKKPKSLLPSMPTLTGVKF